jgi:hypothetical protein
MTHSLGLSKARFPTFANRFAGIYNARVVSWGPSRVRLAVGQYPANGGLADIAALLGGGALTPLPSPHLLGLTNDEQEHIVRKVIRGYAKDKNLNLILIGTIPVPHSNGSVERPSTPAPPPIAAKSII